MKAAAALQGDAERREILRRAGVVVHWDDGSRYTPTYACGTFRSEATFQSPTSITCEACLRERALERAKRTP